MYTRLYFTLSLGSHIYNSMTNTRGRALPCFSLALIINTNIAWKSISLSFLSLSHSLQILLIDARKSSSLFLISLSYTLVLLPVYICTVDVPKNHTSTPHSTSRKKFVSISLSFLSLSLSTHTIHSISLFLKLARFKLV